MRELDEILKIRRDINDLDTRLFELEQMIQPKVQIISDMPRGGDRINLVEEYVIKSDKLKQKRECLCAEIKRKWNEVSALLTACGIPSKQIVVMKLRFFYGLRWNKCSEKMRELYPDCKWNENKLFRIYREVLVKTNKK